jgi:hypothetical protein
MELANIVMNWARRPLDDEPDLFEYAGLTIVLATVVVLWTRVLKNITE